MRKTWLLFSQTVTVALALLFVVATLKPEWLNRPARPWWPGSAIGANATQAAAASGSTDATAVVQPQAGTLAAAARTASVAVVSINTSKNVQLSTRDLNPWYRFFFGEQFGQQEAVPSEQQPRRQQVGLGSGVIVSAEGFVLTNNHVIEGADDIEITLQDGREAKAQVVGTDPESDLAVLRIKLDRLPVITLGNSDVQQVGDTVLAIGNPFGVGQTVTSGIVSATGRNRLGINTFENFIQTDAAINPGNSGGALVDIAGHLIGINTAIYSRSGGNVGIGFAIPVNWAKSVMHSLVQNGTVTRGWIGVEPRDLTPELAQALKLSPQSTGVVITGLLQGGPAHKAGMKVGDIMQSVAGVPVKEVSQLIAAIAAQKPNQAVTIQVQRQGKPVELSVTPAPRPRPKPQN